MTETTPAPGGGDDPASRRARSFGGVAADYHGTRPRYSASAIDWALEPVSGATVSGAAVSSGLGRRLRVLDLAAGTGLLSAAVAGHRPEPEIVAVEPDGDMRAEYLRHRPGAVVVAGTAEDIPAPDGAADAGFDAVVVGTAFHWFDQARALPEIARVLRDGGVVAALWTAPDDEVDWVRAYREASRAVLSSARDRAADPAPGAPVFHGARRGHAHGIGPHPLFTEFTSAAFRHTEVRPLPELVAAVSTYSEVITAPPAERAAAVRATETLLRRRLADLGSAAADRPDSIAVPVVVTVVRGRRHPR